MNRCRKILQLYSKGYNIGDIAETCNCNRKTVSTVINRAKEKQLDISRVRTLTDTQLEKTIYKYSARSEVYKMPDFNEVYREMQEGKTSLRKIYSNYKDDCTNSGVKFYSETQFKNNYKKFLQESGKIPNVTYKAGQFMYIFGIDVSVDNADSNLLYIYLPYSGYLYISEAGNNEICDWIQAHINAFNSLSGIAKIIYCDDIKNIADNNTMDQDYTDFFESCEVIVKYANRHKAIKKQFDATKEFIINMTCDTSEFRNGLNKENAKDFMEYFNNKPLYDNGKSRKDNFSKERSKLKKFTQLNYEIPSVSTVKTDQKGKVEIDDKKYTFSHYKNKTIEMRKTHHSIKFYYDGLEIKEGF